MEYRYEVLPDESVEINTNDDRYIVLTARDLEQFLAEIEDAAELILE